MTIVTTIVFHGLRADDGSAVSQHKAILPRADRSRAALPD